MRRLLPPWALLLLAAILVVGAMVWLRVQPPESSGEEDPLADAAEQLAKGLGLEVDPAGEQGGGVRVTGVRAGSPAEQMEMQAGDRIVACGMQSVWHAYQLADLMSQSLGRGRPAMLLVEREGEYRQVMFGRPGPMAGGGPGAMPGGGPGPMPGGGPGAMPGGRPGEGSE